MAQDRIAPCPKQSWNPRVMNVATIEPPNGACSSMDKFFFVLTRNEDLKLQCDGGNLYYLAFYRDFFFLPRYHATVIRIDHRWLRIPFLVKPEFRCNKSSQTVTNPLPFTVTSGHWHAYPALVIKLN